MKTRVLINALSLLRGGGQVHLINLLKEPIPELVHLYIIRPANLEIQLPGESISAPPYTRNPLLRAMWEFFVLPKILAEKKIDILFCPGGLAITPRLQKIKIATMFQNMSPFDSRRLKKYPFGLAKLRNWILRFALLQSMKRSDKVIFISNFARSVILKLAPQINGRDTVIPHGIPDEFREPQGQVAGFPPSYFVYVSSVDFYKNQLEVVRAYSLLKTRTPHLAPLFFVGHEDPVYGQAVRSEIFRLGLHKDIILLGQRPYRELPAIFARAKLILFASTVENCPNILLESLASGRPVLCSDIQPMPEFGKKAVEYFNPDDPHDLADKWHLILSQTSLQEDLIVRALSEAQNYHWNTAAQRTWSHLLSV